MTNVINNVIIEVDSPVDELDDIYISDSRLWEFSEFVDDVSMEELMKEIYE